MNMNKKDIINALILSSGIGISSLFLSIVYKDTTVSFRYAEIYSLISTFMVTGCVILVFCNFITCFFTNRNYLVNPLLLMLLVIGFYTPLVTLLSVVLVRNFFN